MTISIEATWNSPTPNPWIVRAATIVPTPVP